MTEDENDDEITNYSLFRDYVFDKLTVHSSAGTKKPSRKGRNSSHADDAPENVSNLVEFSDYLAGEIFDNLPDELKVLSRKAPENDPVLSEKWSLPLSLSTLEELAESMSGSVEDSLMAYDLIKPPETDVVSFLSPIIAAYITATTTPPPKWISTKLSACEICERDWVPMTYHHLIPRQIHAKVLKRGWHDEQQLNSVAWLCRACHSFVHKMASNEELAREWYTVDRICSRDDVQKWALWVGKIRWKKK